MIVLELKNIQKTFSNQVKALADFSLEIKSGEFIAIVGPSGCGKSTLLRIIAGLEEEDSGSIILDNKTLNGLPPKNRDMAIMFQNYALFPHLTVAENMGFGLKLRGEKKSDILRQVEEISKTLGIAELLARYPAEMSGGQRQRAALGRAILRKPKVFLFDEPLSNLDAKMRAQMRIEISRLHRQLKSTMIFVTHDQIEAMTMGDRVVVLKDGIIQQVADPDTLYDQPANAFVASFIGSPGMNLFSGKLERKYSEGKKAEEMGEYIFSNDLFSIHLPKKFSEQLKSYPENEIVLGIRPEDFTKEIHANEDQIPLTGKISVVERMGEKVCLYLNQGQSEWAAKLDLATISELKIDKEKNQAITLKLNTEMIHLFSANTGLRI